MNGAHLHLLLNHFPIILSLVSAALLVWGKLSQSAELKKVALVFVIVGGAAAGAAFLTGEPAEEVLEKLPGFAKDLVHEHEEAGEFALIMTCLAALAAAGTLFLFRAKKELAEKVYLGVLLLAFLSCATMLRTGQLGGLIKHEEIRGH